MRTSAKTYKILLKKKTNSNIFLTSLKKDCGHYTGMQKSMLTSTSYHEKHTGKQIPQPISWTDNTIIIRAEDGGH